jgi:transposase
MSTTRTTAQPASTERPSTETQPRSGAWTAAQKLAILTEYESYPKGDPRRGALLRRHGLYTSHISKWRAQRASGALTPRPAGRPAQLRDPQQDENARLQREVARLQAELHKATTIIDIQKKVATLLGVTMSMLPNDAR